MGIFGYFRQKGGSHTIHWDFIIKNWESTALSDLWWFPIDNLLHTPSISLWCIIICTVSDQWLRVYNSINDSPENIERYWKKYCQLSIFPEGSVNSAPYLGVTSNHFEQNHLVSKKHIGQWEDISPNQIIWAQSVSVICISAFLHTLMCEGQCKAGTGTQVLR